MKNKEKKTQIKRPNIKPIEVDEDKNEKNNKASILNKNGNAYSNLLDSRSIEL